MEPPNLDIKAALVQVVKAAFSSGTTKDEVETQLKETCKDIDGITNNAETAAVNDMRLFNENHNSNGPGTSMAGDDTTREVQSLGEAATDGVGATKEKEKEQDDESYVPNDDVKKAEAALAAANQELAGDSKNVDFQKKVKDAEEDLTAARERELTGGRHRRSRRKGRKGSRKGSRKSKKGAKKSKKGAKQSKKGGRSRKNRRKYSRRRKH